MNTELKKTAAKQINQAKQTELERFLSLPEWSELTFEDILDASQIVLETCTDTVYDLEQLKSICGDERAYKKRFATELLIASHRLLKQGQTHASWELLNHCYEGFLKEKLPFNF